MKKTAQILLSLISVSAILTGCLSPAATPSSGNNREQPDISGAESEIQQVLDDSSYSPYTDSMLIQFVKKDYGRIIPDLTSYVEDKWEKEKDSVLYAFADLEGNVICGSLFDSVNYDARSDAYIVRRTADGIAKYGILSASGAKFTGMIFDGAHVAYADDNVCFYGTNYHDGKLWVTGIDKDLNLSETKSINIDADELGVDPATAQLSLSYIRSGRAIIYNFKEFYFKTFVIDTDSGKVLYSCSAGGSKNGKQFGNVIVEQELRGKGITVYDLDGNELLNDKDAYSGKVTENVYMVCKNGELKLFDNDWKEIKSMLTDKDAVAMTSFGRIAVSSNGKTELYDKELNLLNTTDFDLTKGAYMRDWYDFGEGDMYFDSIGGTNEIYNLNTGAKLSKEDSFYYSFKYGFIVADNQSNGNDPVKKYMIYDKDYNLMMRGEGTIELIEDIITGNVYAVSYKDNTMTFYSLPDSNKLFSANVFTYNISAVDGRFYGWSKEGFFLFDGKGNELLTHSVDYKKMLDF